MKRNYTIFTILLTLCYSCNTAPDVNNSNKNYEQVFIMDPDTVSTPTIFIEGLMLVTNNQEREKAVAVEILKLKHKWPLAMQTKNRKLFEEILSDEFTFRGEDEFFNRNDYINDRINGTWNIDSVRYQNLVLQIFGKTALLTYRNILDGTDDNGVPDREYYSWADVYSQEDGIWKILCSHNIDSRIEIKAK